METTMHAALADALAEPSRKNGTLIAGGAALEEAPPAAPGSGSVALDAMKIRCFQTATEFVARGEYQKALDQIRYIVDIEPSNPIVRDFERKVVALALSRGDVDQVPEKSSGQEVDAAESTPEVLPKWVMAAVVVLVVLLAGVTGFYFAWREAAPAGNKVILVR